MLKITRFTDTKNATEHGNRPLSPMVGNVDHPVFFCYFFRRFTKKPRASCKISISSQASRNSFSSCFKRFGSVIGTLPGSSENPVFPLFALLTQVYNVSSLIPSRSAAARLPISFASFNASKRSSELYAFFIINQFFFLSISPHFLVVWDCTFMIALPPM